MKKLFFLTGIVFVLFLFSVSCSDWPTLSGEKVTDQDWETQDKVILFFWTTWCPYCRKEIANLNNICKDLSDKEFKIYLVNVQEPQSKVESFRDKMNITCPIILDRAASLARKYRILGFPTYIFLKKGAELDRANLITIKYVESLYEE